MDKKERKLTKIQIEYLNAINAFQQSKHYSPTYKELATIFNTSTINVRFHVLALAKKEMVNFQKYHSRTIVLTNKSNKYILK